MATPAQATKVAKPTAADEKYLEGDDVVQTLENVAQLLAAAKAAAPDAALPALVQELGIKAQAVTGTTPGDTAAMPEWRALQGHAARPNTIEALLQSEPSRVEDMTLRLDLGEKTATGDNYLLVDFSKATASRAAVADLIKLAEARNVAAARDAMFAGDKINTTEGRSVLHTALRNTTPGAEVRPAGGEDVMPAVRKVQQQMEAFCAKVHSGEWKGASGKAVKYVVNIGIGGSDLGPVMATEALKPLWRGVQPYFVSNIDGTHVAETFKKIDPEETLFVVASKTFTTQETIRNATTARDLMLAAFKAKGIAADGAVAKHFVAVSTNAAEVSAFGIDAERNMFGFWDWVGGRYSLWSAIGLSVALTIGWANFHEMLEGAHAMDTHFRTAPLAKNIPVMMAMLGVWNANFKGCDTHAVLPYSQYLHRLPAYLQQLDMESNGKAAVVGKQLGVTDVATGPIVWGEPGTNGQHAFYQLIHQGTRVVPCDFIGTVETANPVADGEHHRILTANMFAQARALMTGKTSQTVVREHMDKLTPEEMPDIVAHKVFPGNRPSSTFLLRALTARSFGALVAAYEHKVFVQGTVWGINSFDQWGVELGKQLALSILPSLSGTVMPADCDASTASLIQYFKNNAPH